MKKILMTGAAGVVGTFLRNEFRGRYHLRLSDMTAIDDCGPDEEFVEADLSNLEATQNAVAGVEGIIHLGGYSVAGDWETLLNSNIIGTYHAIGFYERSQTIDHTDTLRPDTRYGLSKAFGESLASLYADKYGAEVMNIRIGNVAEKPIDVRRLSIWISPRDIAQLVSIGLEYPDIKYEIVYGMSDNKRAWWDNSNALRLGYAPQDRSEDYAAEVLAEHSADTGDAVADAHQGGDFVTAESIIHPAKMDEH